MNKYLTSFYRFSIPRTSLWYSNVEIQQKCSLLVYFLFMASETLNQKWDSLAAPCMATPYKQHHGSCVPDEHPAREVTHKPICSGHPSIWSWQDWLLRIVEKFSNLFCMPDDSVMHAMDYKYPGERPASCIGLVGDLQLWINQFTDPANPEKRA